MCTFYLALDMLYPMRKEQPRNSSLPCRFEGCNDVKMVILVYSPRLVTLLIDPDIASFR